MKRKISIGIIVGMLLICTACGQQQKQVQMPTGSGGSMIYIYYPDGNKIVQDEEQYQIKLPDSVSSAVEETMTVLMQKLGSNLDYHTYMLDADNNLMLDFTLNKSQAKERILLTDAAICQTLFQIDAIRSINISFLNSDGKELRNNVYMRDSFYFYGDEDMNERELTLYYADKSGTGLTSSVVKVIDQPNMSSEEQLVQILSSRGSIPANVSVRSVSRSGGICYLDLSSEFVGKLPNVKGDVELYSLVNSITNLQGIEAVQLLVEGEVIESYRGVPGVDVPLRFNEDILK